MRRFSCPLCRCNGHPLHECSSLSRVYNISLKNLSSATTTNNQYNFTSPPSTAQAGSTSAVTANRVSNTLPTTVDDTAERYDGFENTMKKILPSVLNSRILTHGQLFSVVLQKRKEEQPDEKILFLRTVPYVYSKRNYFSFIITIRHHNHD